MKENQNIEFKQSWRDEYLQYICGFANAQGGILYIGIDDNGNVCGIDNAGKLLENLPNQINQTMGLLAEVNIHTENGKEYVSVHVDSADQPVSYRGKFYYRSGSTLQEMNGINLKHFILKKADLSYEALPNSQATIEDIDRETIDYFIYCGTQVGRVSGEALKNSTEDILQNLDLLTKDGKLTHAAVLLFGKNPQRFYKSAYFRLGRFGKSPSDLIFQDEVYSNIFQMTNRVLELLRSKYLKTPIHYEGMQRIEELEIPESAMRELLYNAMIHRDYMGDETMMKVYDDHIWLWNAGKLPEGYNTETLQHDHRSLPHNKLIASVFYKAGFIEHWGRGFDKVKSAFLAADIPFPKVENEFWGVSVIIQRKAEQERPDIDIPDVVDFDITDRQRQILELIAKNPSITAAELAKILKVNSRTIQRDFAKLFEKGILIREGSDKSGERNIKMS